MSKPKILLFDIENTPNLAYVWAKYQQDVIEYEKEWEILCFAYRWYGEKPSKVSAHSQKSCGSEKNLVKKLWDLFEEADIIIAHNGDGFDIKKSNAKFLQFGFKPPSGYKTVDTLKVARRYFKFNSNKLDDLGKTLGIGRKNQTGGFELWKGCMVGDRKSWNKMVEYCKQDVKLLESVYEKMKPWMTNHPNYNLLLGTTHNCPACGSGNVTRRGYAHTRTCTYQRYQCECGAWSQGERIKIENSTPVLR